MKSQFLVHLKRSAEHFSAGVVPAASCRAMLGASAALRGFAARFSVRGNLGASLRTVLALLPVLGLLVGCKTATIESRRNERASGYAALLPEQRQLVDKGEIKSGMTEDAVYIAWGPAWEILRGEVEGKATATWIYRGAWWDEQTYWTYRTMRQGGRYYEFPVLDRTSVPRNYVMAEVVFTDGVVKSWRTLARPYF